MTGSVFQNRKDMESRRELLVVVDTQSQDDIGSLPDRTLADSLCRIMGVSTLNNDNIGQFVSVRGVNPDLIPVTLDGITLATIGDTGGGRRQVSLQVVPARAVQQIQAYKSFTSDLKSGAMGGLINLIPASAFDYSGQRLVVDVSTNYSSHGLVDVQCRGSRRAACRGQQAEQIYRHAGRLALARCRRRRQHHGRPDRPLRHLQPLGARFEARNLLNANRELLVGLNLAYRRADIEYGSLFFLHLTYSN
ncbi:TonB-dependent receptor plug domain-containing protein [Sphingomonas sp. M1-B02]|uniref:TonB-dependent receptor plug domain-containing protein n=1 Tax=Sphingomonas sp. M1-B02 TaxID=3114300 RepID=UPI0022403CD4|nr:TonB-dependent receptor plug domain-containing protein [Sphingomonas sp. S6-11]UZK67787.1 TonB-dependent receptor plug domain-containing protein [Sphingomonas sp. S6-11]